MSVINWLFEAAPDQPSFWYLILVGVFALIFVGSLLSYLFRRSLFPSHSLHIRLSGRLGVIGLVLGAVGLAFLGARYASIQFLQMRVWLVLTVVVTFLVSGYAGYFYRTRYPKLLMAYRSEQTRAKFIKPTHQSSGGQRRSKKRRK